MIVESKQVAVPPAVADLVDSLAPARSAMKARPSMSLASVRLHSPEPPGPLRAMAPSYIPGH